MRGLKNKTFDAGCLNEPPEHGHSVPPQSLPLSGWAKIVPTLSFARIARYHVQLKSCLVSNLTKKNETSRDSWHAKTHQMLFAKKKCHRNLHFGCRRLWLAPHPFSDPMSSGHNTANGSRNKEETQPSKSTLRMHLGRCPFFLKNWISSCVCGRPGIKITENCTKNSSNVLKKCWKHKEQGSAFTCHHHSQPSNC